MLDHGRIVAGGAPEELRTGLGTEMVRLQFADPTSYQGALGRLDPARTDEVLRTIDVATGGTADEILAMLGRLDDAGTPAAKVSTYRPTVDDVFLALTRDGHHPRSTGARPMTLTYALKDSTVMIARNVSRSLRDPEAFFTALMLPVMLLFVYVFGGAMKTNGKYVDYVVPGLIVLCAGFGAGTTAVAVATDMTSIIVDRFRSMPIAGSSVLIGHVVASLTRNLVATTLVIAVGLAVGWRPTGSALGWLAAAAMIVLLILALAWLAAAVGLLARTPEAASSLSMVLMFLPYLSTAFVPAHTMPTVLHAFAQRQPFTPIIETMRGLWMEHTSTGASTANQALIAIAWCICLLALSSALASRLFQRRTAADRLTIEVLRVIPAHGKSDAWLRRTGARRPAVEIRCSYDCSLAPAHTTTIRHARCRSSLVDWLGPMRCGRNPSVSSV